MKGRARPPSSPESEESWTVDCPCGVCYDDGEEMVDCDECGVWVHTVCCNILKGHTSYVCDKCKFKKKKESEESEVAQLLVELPSKTPQLEERVFTLRTELSREERAHVQGIPGGDPSFFAGVSAVFSRQLWKHTGHVPKVFQFKYNDLPEEKKDPYVVFEDGVVKREENPDLEYTKSYYQIDEGKLLNTDVQPLGESNADKFYVFQDKQSKREQRKESKHKHRLQQEDAPKSLYHSKRRRDENSKKEFAGKRRSKNSITEDYQGTPRRGFDETTSLYKSSRIASRNAKAVAAYNSVEDADGYIGSAHNNRSKLEELSGHGPHSLGLYSSEDGVASESLFQKPTATKAQRKFSASIRSEREGSNGTRRVTDNASHQEMHFVRREQEGAARNKFATSKNETSLNEDVAKAKDQIGGYSHVDGKGGLVGYHSTLEDPKEASQRVRLNVLVSAKDQVEETTNEPFSPSPVNEKSWQIGKHFNNEDTSFASRQQSLSQKQSEVVGLAMTKPPISEGCAISPSDDDDDERPLSSRVTNERHIEESLQVPIDQLEHEPDTVKRQDPTPLTPPSPVKLASPQDVNAPPFAAMAASVGAIGNLHLVLDDSIRSSPRSVQTGPSRSAEMSSPTLSGPGVDSRQHVSTKLDSRSPPSERALNVGFAQSVPFSKASTGSPTNCNNRAYTPVTSKSGNAPAQALAKSSSSSKHRSRTHDARKADAAAAMPKDLSETPTNLSSHKEFKELSKSSENKVAGIGKAKAALHTKGQPSAAKHMGHPLPIGDSGVQGNAPEQNLLQSKHPVKSMPTSMSHKPEKGLVAGCKSTSMLTSPTRVSNLDLHMQATEATRPALNDEELALLLHQELNSSPRVARVARVRQSGTGPHPFSTKRPALGTTPAASTATQKDPHLIFRRKNRDEAHGGVDDVFKVDVPGGSVRQDVGSMPQSGSRKDKDIADAGKAQSLPTAELSRHLSPGPGAATESQLHSDSPGSYDPEDGERRTPPDSILTLPGLIEEILNEKGANVSYDHICEEVLPHWSKLRKHNGERYAYTSHRQAVLDCLRNRSAWSHLIDRGPKTNLGRKRRRLESSGGMESEHGEHFSHFQDGGEDNMLEKSHKEAGGDGSESWPLSDSNKDADLSLPEEVPKGKRKARRGRRLTAQSQGYGGRGRHGKGERIGESVHGVEDDLDRMVSPFSEDPASSSEDDEIFVHRSASRHLSRHRESSIDSEDDDDADL